MLVLTGPRQRHPHRDYLLFSGRLETELATGFDVGSLDSQSPNLVWPADRTWCVAIEIDFDSTVVGGPVALIDEALADPTLEAWRVEHDGVIPCAATIRLRSTTTPQ